MVVISYYEYYRQATLAIKNIPDNLKKDSDELQNDLEDIAMTNALLRCIVNGLHTVELQLEKLTGEAIDDDDRSIV